MVYLFVHGFRMLLDFFVWDVKKVWNIYRNRHAVAGRRLLARLFSGFSECMWLILKTLRRLRRHISFVWLASNLLQQVSVAVVQISDRYSQSTSRVTAWFWNLKREFKFMWQFWTLVARFRIPVATSLVLRRWIAVKYHFSYFYLKTWELSGF